MYAAVPHDEIRAARVHALVAARAVPEGVDGYLHRVERNRGAGEREVLAVESHERAAFRQGFADHEGVGEAVGHVGGPDGNSVGPAEDAGKGSLGITAARLGAKIPALAAVIAVG